MVWGAICYEDRVRLEVVSGTLNAESYMDILRGFFKDVAYLDDKQWRFQQDGAPAHRAVKVKALLEENDLLIHEHPPNSPDLNPIENLWAYMKDQVEAKEPSSEQELVDAIFEVWDEIPLQVIKNIIDHLRPYLQTVVDCNGAWPQRP